MILEIKYLLFSLSSKSILIAECTPYPSTNL
uniref:Uncharacterized protein n=1 Tax=Podoviridae sp. ct8Lf7 TaxID=2827723 RepID=A0A8S5S233_9CAUD|nr:MAG TPA: hypothetical protein [Podoviridae sp. ct8Lf7]